MTNPIHNNRAFLYGDALFDTLLIIDNQIPFLEEHYFRLLAGMRQLRMEIPNHFTQDYWEDAIKKKYSKSGFTKARVRTTVYRDTEGLYTPIDNTISFQIDIQNYNYNTRKHYKLGVYKDNFIATSSLSNIKTTNRLINILASIYAKENIYDNVVLLNQKKQIVEVSNANIFLVFNNHIKTPALSEGCINGIIRNKLIDSIKSSNDLTIEETEISVYELLQADEIFISNSVINIQSITDYKKKKYGNDIAMLLSEKLQALV